MSIKRRAMPVGTVSIHERIAAEYNRLQERYREMDRLFDKHRYTGRTPMTDALERGEVVPYYLGKLIAERDGK